MKRILLLIVVTLSSCAHYYDAHKVRKVALKNSKKIKKVIPMLEDDYQSKKDYIDNYCSEKEYLYCGEMYQSLGLLNHHKLVLIETIKKLDPIDQKLKEVTSHKKQIFSNDPEWNQIESVEKGYKSLSAEYNQLTKNYQSESHHLEKLAKQYLPKQMDLKRLVSSLKKNEKNLKKWRKKSEKQLSKYKQQVEKRGNPASYVKKLQEAEVIMSSIKMKEKEFVSLSDRFQFQAKASGLKYVGTDSVEYKKVEEIKKLAKSIEKDSARLSKLSD